MKPVFKVILMAVAYLATFILGASTGAIHPAYYAYIGALLPLVFAFIYLYTCSIIQGFGAATAVEEMPSGYDQLMLPVINNIPVLVTVLVLTILVAILAMCLAERILKKPAATLK